MACTNLRKAGMVWTLLFLSLLSFSQNKQVSGKVTDVKDGTPLQGVTVSGKGSRASAQTGADGSYSISLPASVNTLVFSYVGFTSREIPVSGGAELSIALTSNNTSLGEVVVIGYGTQRRREVTGAISKVSAAEITALPTPSFEASLQGRVAGVQVSQSSGLAGAGSYVRIRGLASVSAGGDPLYVIDGIPVSADPLTLEGTAAGTSSYKIRSGFTQSPLAAINPDDIESIEILKDAGAAGIYGSRGANGVILITTKRGKGGKPQFNFTTKFGLVTPSVKPRLLNGSEWLQLRQEGYENDGHTGPAPLPNGLPLAQAQSTNTDWFDLLTQTGLTQDYNLSMSYGKKKFKSYIGGTYGSDESYAVGNKFTRATIRGNFDYTFTSWLKASLNSSYSSGLNYRVPTGWAGGIGSAMSGALPIFRPYKPDGSYDLANANPLEPILEDKFRSDDRRTLGGLTLILTPVKNLDIKLTGNLDNYINYTDQYTNNQIKSAGSFNAAERWKANITNANYTATATYRYDLDSKNSFNFLAGGEYQRSIIKTLHYYSSRASVDGPFYDNSSLLDSASVDYPKNFPDISRRDSSIADRWSFISYFGRVNYSYKNKLYLQVLARVDGSSKFGPNNRYGFFPAASAAWVATDEDFVKNILPTLSLLKFRVSYGITGNASIPSFRYLDNWNYSAANGNAPYNGQATLAQTQVANPDLKWETAKNFDAGVEFGLAKDRITGEIGYYNKLSEDVIMNVGLEEGYGIGKSSIFANIGKIKNEGVELSLSVKLINNKTTSWSIFANAAHNYNVVLDAGGYKPDAIQSGTNETRVLEGYPVSTLYTIVYLGTDPADGLPIWLDQNGHQTKIFPSLDARRPAGKLIPDWTGGFGTNFKYKGLEMRMLFAFATGLDIWDNSGKGQFLGVSSGQNWNMRQEFLDHWRQPGDVTRYPRLVYDQLYPGLSKVDDLSSTLFIYKGDYLRLRELTLAYAFNRKTLTKVKFIKDLKIFVTGMNLLLFTKYKGGDPEVNRDADGGATDRNMSPNVTYLTAPQAKSIQFGVNINF